MLPQNLQKQQMLRQKISAAVLEAAAAAAEVAAAAAEVAAAEAEVVAFVSGACQFEPL